MNKSRFFAPLLLALALPLAAQIVADDPDWKESPVPPAPMFDLNRLVKVEVFAQSPMQWGVDSQSIQISKSDSVVRYVIVARSPSGVVNAMYEGLRCNKAEVITYARYNKDSGWVNVSRPEWKSFRDTAGLRHAGQAAKQGLCDGSAPPATVRHAVERLRKGAEITP
ncbi:MAG: CNP1-like family protein [Brachymonas sp.]